MVSSRLGRVLLAATAIAAILGAPPRAFAHPMGNFAICHYARITGGPTTIQVHYLLDMAEIPTVSEINWKVRPFRASAARCSKK